MRIILSLTFTQFVASGLSTRRMYWTPNYTRVRKTQYVTGSESGSRIDNWRTKYSLFSTMNSIRFLFSSHYKFCSAKVMKIMNEMLQWHMQYSLRCMMILLENLVGNGVVKLLNTWFISRPRVRVISSQ